MSLLPTLAPETLYSLRSEHSSSSPHFFLLFPNRNPYSRSLTFSTRTPRRLLSSHVSASAAAADPNPKPKAKGRRPPKPDPPPQGTEAVEGGPGAGDAFPTTIPGKPRRGRRSEAAAVEDFVRDRLERTFASIREQSAGVLEGKEGVLKERRTEEGSEGEGKAEEEVVVEEDDPDWPLDADVGWGIRASEYFDKHPIKNVVEDGVEIDWEGEMDEGWVKEINCLEWESFAFHPSPLVVLVFERYNRAAHNWKLLKELEKAAKVYWDAKDRLPPRTIKIDINIEKDLAYALNVKTCPELLFLKGNKILYREKEFRTSDELVQMIAHFYYNAKRPSWVDSARVSSPF
ncbi:hypothetical protein C4D60_Mb01t10050 [Musa balbisiana]|uniref:Thioredoxin domain-containing protein n=1 Tax=Musa balbisiana TaxID=52838 RepID=A0A4S8JL50_MUSBA|nr:hypothetical protein C4D60_Mb01t10050 [Musa balbisiana]